MAGLLDLLKQEKDNGNEARKACKTIAKDFPHVAEILGGIAGKEGQETVSPSAISIWIQDGQARFSTNVKSANRTIIGDIADLAKPWESINYAIGDGKVSSKRFTEPKASVTEAQEKLLL